MQRSGEQIGCVPERPPWTTKSSAEASAGGNVHTAVDVVIAVGFLLLGTNRGEVESNI